MNLNNKHSAPGKSTSLLLLFAIIIFAVAILVFIYKNIFHMDFNTEILKRNRVTFLVNSFQQDTLVMSAMVNLYPAQAKAGIYFVNPLIRFRKDDQPLIMEGKSASRKIKTNLEDITGTRIQHTFNITENNFRRIIDLLEGLNMFTDPATTRSGKNYSRIAGEYTMYGDDLLDYATVLENEEPLEYIHRISRQESIFLTIYDKLRTIKVSDEFIGIIYELADTTLSRDEFISVFNFLQSTHLIFSIAELPAEPALIPGTRKFAMDIKEDTVKTAYHQFEKEITSDYFMDGEKARIEVLNFTEVNGLAKNVKSILQDKRLKVLSSSNGWLTELNESVVLDRSGNTEYTWKTAEALDIKKVRHSIRKDIGMDTTVMLGEDFGQRYKDKN